MPTRPRLPTRRSVSAVLGGLLVAAALPPWGFWPLAFAGVGVYSSAHARADSRRARFTTGWLFGAAWLYPGMVWMWFLTAPGYLIAAAMFAAFHGLAAMSAPRGRWRVVGLPAAHVLAEALRFCFPFGGVPLASLAIGQAAGPFVGTTRVGGALLLSWFVLQVGTAATALAPSLLDRARRRADARPLPAASGIALAAALAAWLGSPLASGEVAGDSGAVAVRVAVVQGGGPQGTHAIHTDPRRVVERHLAATATIEPGSVDLVVWPENVIDVVDFPQSRELQEVAAEAARIGAPFAVGITEDTVDGDHFLNAQVMVTPDGAVTGRYEKVRRVPFGEYMPMRGLLHALGAPTDLVPRDAVAGEGPAVLDMPDGTRLGVVISWEVFFGGRGNDGVSHGAGFIINPTNGSSYTWTVLQSQQIAASRLRAVEQNRWVVQASPTGFSAFISPDADVYSRTSVSAQQVIEHEVLSRPSVRTWYSHTGDIPWVMVMAVLVGLSWWLDHRTIRSAD